VNGRESGIALPMALFTLAVLSGLVAGVFVFVLYSHRSGTALSGLEEAQYQAEGAAYRSLEFWDPAYLADLPPGSSVESVLGDPRGTSRVTAFGEGIFLLEGAFAGSRGAHRVVGISARLVAPSLVLNRALSTGSSVSIDAGAAVTMTNPGEESSCGPAGEGSREDFGASAYESFDEWAGRAGAVLVGGVTLSPHPSFSSLGCDATDPLNWGDPLGGSSCSGYFPARLVTGDLIVQGGMGQGVLVVGGSLTMSAGFHYRGLIIVRGGLTTAGSTAEGAMQVQDSLGAGISIGAGSEIRYSPCWLNRALLRYGTLAALTRRAWIQLYGDVSH
jgi:hypothetical protein